MVQVRHVEVRVRLAPVLVLVDVPPLHRAVVMLVVPVVVPVPVGVAHRLVGVGVRMPLAVDEREPSGHERARADEEIAEAGGRARAADIAESVLPVR